jgi:hypothetical protein
MMSEIPVTHTTEDVRCPNDGEMTNKRCWKCGWVREGGTGMDDLVTWLRAQLDDDERVARTGTCEAWTVCRDDEGPTVVTEAAHAAYANDKNPRPWPVITNGDFHSAVDEPDAEHIARWDPTRVLAEVDAKRKLLDVFGSELCDDETDETAQHCVKLLGLPYAHRQGFREEWRPDA